MLAKQNTARTIPVGPILDADGAAVTTEVVGNIKVWKNGTPGAPNAGSTLTHDAAGHYAYAAHADDLDTLGEVTISLNSGTNAMAPVAVQVVPAAVYDAMIAGTGKLPASLAAGDVTGHLPADVKAYTVQPTVTGATLHADYNAAKTAASQESVDDLGSPMQAGAEVALAANQNVYVDGFTTPGMGALNTVIAGATGHRFDAVDDALEGVATEEGLNSLSLAVGAIPIQGPRSAPRVPAYMEVPDEEFSPAIYAGELYIFAPTGHLQDATGNTVIVHARTATGQSLDANLDSTTMTRLGPGRYRFNYSVQHGLPPRAVYFDFTWSVNGVSMADGAVSLVSDAEINTALQQLKSTVEAVKERTDGLPNDPASETTVNSRLAAAAYTAPDNAGIATAASAAASAATAAEGAKATTDKLGTAIEEHGEAWRFTADALAEAPTGGADGPTAGEIADAVLDELLEGHEVPGSVATKLNAAAAAGDPLASEIPGDYTGSQAGAKLAQIYNHVAGTIFEPSGVVPAEGTMPPIVEGDDYSDNPIVLNITWGGVSPAGAAAVVRFQPVAYYGVTPGYGVVTAEATVGEQDADGTYPIAIALTAEQAAQLKGDRSEQPNYRWEIEATVSGKPHTIARGTVAVLEPID